MHRLNIVQPSVKSRSRSGMVDGSGQDVSWPMCVRSFISVEASVCENRS